MLVKENNNYIALCTLEGLTAWIKTGVNRGFTGKEYEVITALVISKEGNNKEVIYKYIDGNWITYYNSKDGFTICDIIEDILQFVAHYNKGSFYMNKFVSEAINNQHSALLIIKRYNKEYKEYLQQLKRAEENKQINIQVQNIKNQISDTLQDINKYVEMRYHKPCEINDYTHEIYTIDTLKTFKAFTSERLETHKNILNFLSKYLNCLQCDFDPIEFLEFDKVIKVGY